MHFKLRGGGGGGAGCYVDEMEIVLLVGWCNVGGLHIIETFTRFMHHYLFTLQGQFMDDKKVKINFLN